MLRRRVGSLTGNEARPSSNAFLTRARVGSLGGNESRSPTNSPITPEPSYPHVSSYGTTSMDVRIWSPSVKLMGLDPVPVFGDGDKVEGTVTLDHKSSPSGRLLVTIEGSFHYNTPDPNTEGDSERRKHIFYSSTSSTPVMPLDSFLNMAPPSRSTMTFGRLKRRPSATSLNTPPPSATTSRPLGLRTYPFCFDLPRGWRSGEELPPTFTSSYSQSGANTSSCTSSRKNTVSPPGSFGVEYKISVSWEPYDAAEFPSSLDVPIYYHSDPDFQSLDGVDDKSWLEMPLRSERPIPFRCAVTLPTSVTFSRTSSIPYYVVFTTTPRNPVLTREIASDATISVTLMRQITVTESSTLPPTPPQTPSSGSSASEEGGPLSSRSGKLFNRVKNGPWSPRIGTDENFDSSREKPLPRLPMHTVFKETRLLHTSMCIGFPKRPRQHTRKGEKHPSLDSQCALPDGLHKAKFVLNKDMLPSIDWSGVSVKYYLDVSVLVGQDDVRARIPIRVV